MSDFTNESWRESMNIKTKALKVFDQFLENIGLMRTATHEEFRGKCEEFAKDYMAGASGVTVGREPGWIKGGTISKTLVVCGSGVSIVGSRLEQGMAVAPWAKNFYAQEVVSIADPMKNHRALINFDQVLDLTLHDVTVQVGKS